MYYDLIQLIICPVCSGKLIYHKNRKELICYFDSLSYPLKNGILILLENKAQSFN